MYKPTFTITPELVRLIVEATELRAWIGQAVVDVAWLPALQGETAARLAHSSTSIEGNPLSLADVEALHRGDPVPAGEKAKAEVRNYLAAMRWVWAQKSGQAIDESSLLHLHRLLRQKTLDVESIGKYKTRPNRVVDGRGLTVYTPPPPTLSQPLTLELLSWINSSEGLSLHPVIVGAIAHHRLVSIHPFSDGNGRLARVLEVWLLYTRGFDTHHLFALDEYFEADRQRYYEKIQQARDLDNDLTYWLEYVADGVLGTLRETKKRILALQIGAKGTRIVLTKRQEDILRFLRDKGRMKSSDIERALGISRARVGQLIQPLVEARLIVREGRTRATTYRLEL